MRVIIVSLALLSLLSCDLFPQQPASKSSSANPMRPATITWGGVSNNEQIAGSDALWPFVQKHMDAFFMHGAYWLFTKDEAGVKSLTTLGQILQKHGKTAHLETGFGESEGYNPAIPAKRAPYQRAQSDIAKFREFSEKYGVKISKVRVDWFPMTAMGVYANHYKTTDMRQLMAMVTGAKEFGSPAEGFDMQNAHWVEYGRELQTAFPQMEIAFDQALCNHGPVSDPEIRKIVPWEAFGLGYKRQLKERNGTPVLVNGQQLEINFDFADQLFGVMSASKDHGINFIGFEGDTPFNYFEANSPNFPGDALIQYLLKVERTLHKHGLKNGRIVNDCGKEYGTSDAGWIQVDLGTPQQVDRARVTWGAGFGTNGILFFSADGQIWTGANRKLEAPINGISECKFKPQLARFVKIELRKRGTPNGYQISELELFGPTQPEVNLALKKRANASSIRPGHPADGRKGGITEMTDGNPETSWESFCLSNDAWDQRYHDRTMEYLEFYQGAGGRADEYIAESWYDGPFTLFPETKPGTFSNLARNLIRRIKGIDDDGKLLTADLAIRRKGEASFNASKRRISCSLKAGESKEFDIQIRNTSTEKQKGDTRATPLLRAEADGAIAVSCFAQDGKEITEQALCHGDFDGYFVGGLEPGQTRTVSVRISPRADGAASGRLALKLYWNPQDPQAVVRDSVLIKVK